MYLCRDDENELKIKLRTIKLIILDFDGILYNLSTNYNWIEARRKLTSLVIKHGFPLKRLLQIIDPFDFLNIVDKEKNPKLYKEVSEILKYYEIIALKKSKPIPHASQLLALLLNKGISLCVVSLQPTDIIRHALTICCPGLTIPIFGRDSAGKPKPWPDHIAACISVSGCNPNYSLMIGDGLADVVAAKKAEVSFIGIELGLFTRYELCEYGALAVFRDVGEFLEYLKRIYSS